MKIAICVPHHGDVKAEFAISLVRLVTATLAEPNFLVNGAKARPEIKPFFVTASLVQVARISLAEQALEWGADYILWADSDHAFPAKSLLRLLSHDVDVVGVDYPRRAPPHELTAISMDGKRLRPGSGLEPVISMGFGLCLVKTAVFRNLRRPWFQVTVRADNSVIGEDFHFFHILREAGVTAYIDHDLSAEVGHVAQQILSLKNVGPPAD